MTRRMLILPVVLAVFPTALFEQQPNAGCDALDDLHPNAKGYAIMGPLAEAAIQKALK